MCVRIRVCTFACTYVSNATTLRTFYPHLFRKQTLMPSIISLFICLNVRLAVQVRFPFKLSMANESTKIVVSSYR